MSKKHREPRPARSSTDEAPDVSTPDGPEAAPEGAAEELPEADRLALEAMDSERAFRETQDAPTLAGADLADEPAAPAPAVAAESPPPSRPSFEDILAAAQLGMSVEVCLLPHLDRARVAGLNVDNTPRVFPLARVRDLGPSYLRALADNDGITVRIVDPQD